MDIKVLMSYVLEPNSNLFTCNGCFNSPLFGVIVGYCSTLGLHDDSGAKHAEILIMLIKQGSDPFQAEWTDANNLSRTIDGLMSPKISALNVESQSLWSTTLKEFVCAWEQVLSEDTRCRKEFLRLHGAKRTAVDISELQQTGSSKLHYLKRIVDNENYLARKDDRRPKT